MNGFPTENPNDVFEQMKENFLHFLDEVNTNYLDGNMSDDARFKNIHLFNMSVNLIKDAVETGNQRLMRELLKKHKLIRVLKNELEYKTFFSNNKAELQTAKYFLLPEIEIENGIFDTGSFDVNSIIILEKKDNLRSAGQKIGERIMGLLPGKEPVKA